MDYSSAQSSDSAQRLDFSHQDCRDRSFRYRDLSHANFESADVRGCDFRNAQLEGATFKNARLGRTRRQIITTLVTVTLLLVLALHAFSHMLLGGLGTTRDAPAWGYVMALQISLAVAGGFTSLQHWRPQLQWLSAGMRMIAGMSICALLGFFYGGSLTGNNPQVAITTAIVLSLMGVIIGMGWGPRGLNAGITLLGAIAAYGFCFAAGTNASTVLTTQHYGAGVLWVAISMTYLKLTLDALNLASRRLLASMTTCFDSFL